MEIEFEETKLDFPEIKYEYLDHTADVQIDVDANAGVNPLELRTIPPKPALVMPSIVASSSPTQPPPKTNYSATVVSIRPGAPTADQLTILMGFIEQHGLLASGHLWSQITNEINEAGPLFQTAQTWKKTFTDLRNNAIRKRRVDRQRLNKLEIRALSIPIAMIVTPAKQVQQLRVCSPKKVVSQPQLSQEESSNRRRSQTPPPVRRDSHKSQSISDKLDGIMEMLSCANDMQAEVLKVKKATLKIEERKLAIKERRMQILEADITRKATMRAAFHRRWLTKSDNTIIINKPMPTITKVQKTRNNVQSAVVSSPPDNNIFNPIDELDFLGSGSE